MVNLMMKKNENRPGYKKTKVGWIPEEWEAVNGKDISKKITKGSSPNWQGFDYQSDGVLFITSENVRDGYLDISSPKFLPLEFNKKLKHSVLEEGDLLINIVGASIGRACKFSGSEWPANVNQAVCVLRCKTDVSYEFLLSYFQTSRAIDRLFSSQVESARPNVSLTDIRDFPLPRPPFPEQKAIAGVLECWDRGIRNLELKIENKRRTKKGLMQRLLSGKTRLSGFSNDWKEKKIDEIFDVTRGQVLAVSKMQQNQNEKYCYPVYSSQTKSNGLTGYYTEHLYENAITWTTDGANAGDVKYRSGKFYCTNVCGVLLGEYTNQCIAEMLNMVSEKYVSYVGNPKLMNNVMAKIKITLPPLEEQQAIAKVLSAADGEIEVLERKLATWKDQKKFLLNNLVTGSIRLPEFRTTN